MSITNSQQVALVVGCDSRPQILYLRNYIQYPNNEGKMKMQEEEDLSDKELAQYEVDIKLKNILIYRLINEIYNSIDLNQTSKELWNALKRTQHGADVGNQNLNVLDINNVFNILNHNQEEVDDIKELKNTDKKDTISQIQTNDPLAFVTSSPPLARQSQGSIT
ncbi:hypothetical protein Tco_0382002 [Tanacetum coccineum]